MDKNYFRIITSSIILMVLLVLTFFLLKPLLMAIVIGFILAFIFNPVYVKLNKVIKSKNIASGLICFVLLILVLLPFWFFTPLVIDQAIKVYFLTQDFDFVGLLQGIFPSLFASEEFSREIGSILYSFFTKSANSFVNIFTDMILNFPVLFLQSMVVFFTLFFVLKDKEKLISYIGGLLPFSKNVEGRIFSSSKSITEAVIYGQIIVGLVQGLVLGAGFFIMGVSNALFLTLLACLAGIFPVVGTAIIWIPMVIYMFVTGDIFTGIGLTIFGGISSTLDNLLRPIIVSKKVRMNTALVVIGMIGGLLMFGVLGFVLGPLILAYLFIVLEVYKDIKLRNTAMDLLYKRI
jgi:predicted PurR-regulated permease PerM